MKVPGGSEGDSTYPFSKLNISLFGFSEAARHLPPLVKMACTRSERFPPGTTSQYCLVTIT